MLILLRKRRTNALDKEALILVLEKKIVKRRRKTSIKLANFGLVKPIEFIT